MNAIFGTKPTVGRVVTVNSIERDQRRKRLGSSGIFGSEIFTVPTPWCHKGDHL